MLGLTLVLAAPVGQNPEQGYLTLLKERQDPVIQDICSSNGMLGLT